MGALIYLYKRSFINRVKVAVKKPVTYVWGAFILIYCLMIPFSFKVLVEEFDMVSPDAMAALMAVIGFLLIPSNLISYAKRKGLIFKKGEVHFMFPSPISPKRILLYAHLKNTLIMVLLNAIGALLGGFLFRIVWWKLIVFFIFSLGIQGVLEGSIMMIMYGSEKIHEKSRKYIVALAYGLMGAVILAAVYTLSTKGFSIDSALAFLHSDLLQAIPVIGWYVAVIHLIFTTPTVCSVVCSIIYMVLVVVMFVIAFRMKCTGAYFEDATKFADDYADLIAKQKAGSMQMVVGKKTKYGKADIKYKGTGAKALFYRQLLEYKKSKFFIFDANTVACIVAAGLMIYLNFTEDGFGDATPFVIPGLMAYLIFIFGTMPSKWTKEVKYPFTYMIPDSNFSKVFYGTLMQLIQAAVNGTLLSVPLGIVLGYNPFVIVLCVLTYVALSGSKLYAMTVTEIITGDVLGQVGKQFFQLLIQGIVITFGILGGVAGFFIAGEIGAYVGIILFLVLCNLGMMLITSMNFDKVETA